MTRVTIIDSDSPGKVGFKHKTTEVNASERAAMIPVYRKHGSTGHISVKFKTEEDEEGSKQSLDGVESWNSYSHYLKYQIEWSKLIYKLKNVHKISKSNSLSCQICILVRYKIKTATFIY